MSTHSTIARPMTPDGSTWQGRYIHWNGYPTCQLITIKKLVEREGVDKVLETLNDKNYGWSMVDADRQTKDVGEYEIYGKDRRFKLVKGYGIAYTDTVIKGFEQRTGYQQATADDWVTDADDGDVDWVYILGNYSVRVLYDGKYIATISYIDIDQSHAKDIEKLSHGED